MTGCTEAERGRKRCWQHSRDLQAFAYRHPEHRRVIAAAASGRWCAEELFARFEVLAITGDQNLLGWPADGRKGGAGGHETRRLDPR